MSGFPTTAWTVVSRARSGVDSEAREALAFLCAAYWLPLYSFARRLGHASEDALDLTQGYFALLIEKDYLADVRLREGRFRAFLLTSFRHFLSKERDRARALKRGGGRVLLSIDAQEAEGRHADEPLEALDPEALFERRWALTILERAMTRLRHEFAAAGRRVEFEQLEPYLTGSEPKVPYQSAAERLGTTEGAIKKMVHRLRRRYGLLLREEIAATVADPEEIDAELRHLLATVRPWEPAAIVTFPAVFVLVISEKKTCHVGAGELSRLRGAADDEWRVGGQVCPLSAGACGGGEPAGPVGAVRRNHGCRTVRCIGSLPSIADPGWPLSSAAAAGPWWPGRGVARLRPQTPRGGGAQVGATGFDPRRSRARAVAARGPERPPDCLAQRVPGVRSGRRGWPRDGVDGIRGRHHAGRSPAGTRARWTSVGRARSPRNCWRVSRRFTPPG